MFATQGLCELAVQKGISVDTAPPLLHTSDELGASRLRDICMRFVVRHFDTVSKLEVCVQAHGIDKSWSISFARLVEDVILRGVLYYTDYIAV